MPTPIDDMRARVLSNLPSFAMMVKHCAADMTLEQLAFLDGHFTYALDTLRPEPGMPGSAKRHPATEPGAGHPSTCGCPLCERARS